MAISALNESAPNGPWWRGITLRRPETYSRRAIGIAATIIIELLILLALLTLGGNPQPAPADTATLTTFDASEPSSDSAQDEAEPEAEEQPDTPQQVDAPAPVQAPVAPVPPPSALPRPSLRPQPVQLPQPQPQPEPAPSPSPTSTIRAVVRPGSNYGPPDTGRRGPPDTQVVGTAPDGSPLYAAQWYREPYDSELAGYLSTARGPGWGLIACKTAPQWRVEDCVIVGESPAGSGIARSTLAAAWQFQVRPPRLDGEYQVGAWVRIRMTYGTGRGPGG